MNKIYCLTLLLIAFSQSALATDWAETNKAIVNNFAIPHFKQLQDSSEQLAKQTDTFCQKGGDAEFIKTQKKFYRMMDAWQQVQILRTGPEELLMRNFRIEMWPDRSNTGAKQIRKLLAAKKSESLKPKSFSRSSTAVQGLPAVERLMFSKGVDASKFHDDGNANYRCQLLQAITINLQSISEGLLKDWSTSYKKSVTEQNKDNEVFTSHKDAATVFLKEVATELQAVFDQKFKRPLGSLIEEERRFRPKRAESWRSGHSLQNITHNLVSAEQLFNIGFLPHLEDKSLKDNVKLAFRRAIETGENFKIPLLKAHEEKPEALVAWMKEVSLLKRLITVDVPKALDINLGFNSLDGD